MGILAIAQAALRIYFALGSSGVLGLQVQESVRRMVEVTMTEGDWAFLMIMFGAIGIAGAIGAIGLLLSASWGYYGTIVVSAATIAYDAWAMLTIRSSAAIGLILPAAFIAYLIAKRGSLTSGKVRPNGSSGGVRN